MTLNELKQAIEGARIFPHESPDEIEVIITLQEPSMGPRAGVSLKHAIMGFDWEAGQFRLQPEDALARKGRALGDAMEPGCRKMDGRMVHYCRNCGEQVLTRDNFCSRCGQKLKHEGASEK